MPERHNFAFRMTSVASPASARSSLFTALASSSTIAANILSICNATARFQELVQLFFPGLHELLIILSRKFGHELIAGETNTGVAVSNICKTSVAIFGKLNLQSARCDSGQNLQHFDEPSLRLVTRDIPDCSPGFVRRD